MMGRTTIIRSSPAEDPSTGSGEIVRRAPLSGPDRASFFGFLVAALALAGGCATGGEQQQPARVPYPPVLRADFPDPFILEHEGQYLAYATNAGGVNVQMASSTDLWTWQFLRDEREPGR